MALCLFSGANGRRARARGHAQFRLDWLRALQLLRR